MANRRHVHPQLVGAPGQRLQLNPGGLAAGLIDHPVAGPGALARAALIDHHLFAAATRLFGERQLDQPVLDLRHPHHQRPIDLARRAAREMLGKISRAARRACDQQHARGILVEPVDEPGPRAFVGGIGIEQAIDMLIGTAAALRGEARRLVKHQRRGRAQDYHVFGHVQLGFGQGLGHPRGLGRGIAARRHPHDLSGGDPVSRIGALAVQADLPGPGPAADRGKADLRQVALEPAIKPRPVIVRRNGELANLGVVGAQRIVVFAHAATRIRPSPANSAARPAQTDSAA